MAAQLMWNRTVNIHGRPSRNISSDLHMEHLNHLCKSAISGMGSNVTEVSVQRVGRAIKCLDDSMVNFGKQHLIHEESGKYTVKSGVNDFEKVLKQIFYIIMCLVISLLDIIQLLQVLLLILLRSCNQRI